MIALGHLYLVATPRPQMAEAEFLARIGAALDGGVDLLQLRCKNVSTMEYIRLAEHVRELALARRVPFVINDRVDVALAVGADGVHLGQDDLPPGWARRVLIGHPIVGRSSHEPGHAEQALSERATYFAVGPVWETPTKPGRPAAGLEYVRHVASRQPDLPWFAIGGITRDNLPRVLEAGATRIAVVRAILDAGDPAAAARTFVEMLQSEAVLEGRRCT